MAGIALDGTPVHATGVSSTQVMPALTTTVMGVVVVAIELNHGTVITLSNTSGLTWARRATTNSAFDNFVLEVWWAYSTVPLSSDVITINGLGTVDFIAATAFGVKNANRFAPWDIGSLPVTSQLNGPVSVTTTEPETLIIGAYRSQDTGSPTQGAGFTLISGSDFLLVEYKIVTTVQTGLSVAANAGTINGGIGDALAGFRFAPPFPPRYQANLRI